MKRKMGSIFLCSMLSVLCLSGCVGVEPEKRSYPLMMAADYGDTGYEVLYGMPDMGVITGQNKSKGEEESQAVLGFQGKTLEEIKEACYASQEKYLDLGHLQVLVLGDGLLESGKWVTLLRTLRQDPAIGEDIYLFTAPDIQAVMELNGTLSSSLGEYLVGIYENRPQPERRKGSSLRKAYGEMLETGTLQKLPALYVREGSIRIVSPV